MSLGGLIGGVIKALKGGGSDDGKNASAAIPQDEAPKADTSKLKEPSTQAMPMPNAAATQTAPKSDFLSRFTKTLMGRADADLSPDELAKRQASRRQASSMATNAMQNPGEGFDTAPNNGNGFGLQDIAAVIHRIFK